MFKRVKEIKQYMKQGFKNSDLWSLDYFLSDTFARMIREFRKGKIGNPMGISFEDIKDFSIEFIEYSMKIIEDEFYDSGYFNKKDNDAEDIIDLFDEFTQWSIILLRIAYCLEMTQEEKYENEYSDEYFDQVFGKYGWKSEQVKDETTNKTFYKIVTNKPDEELKKKFEDREEEIYDLREAYKDEAFKLLSKWFFNLWD